MRAKRGEAAESERERERGAGFAAAAAARCARDGAVFVPLFLFCGVFRLFCVRLCGAHDRARQSWGRCPTQASAHAAFRWEARAATEGRVRPVHVWRMGVGSAVWAPLPPLLRMLPAHQRDQHEMHICVRQAHGIVCGVASGHHEMPGAILHLVCWVVCMWVVGCAVARWGAVQ